MDNFDAFCNGPTYVFNTRYDGKCPKVRLCITYFVLFLEFFVRKLLGKILIVAVYSLVLYVIFIAFAIILPYESQNWSIGFKIFIIFYALYLTINVFYHYYKASTTLAGRPLRSQQLPLCNRCNNHKSVNTHHCSMCGECVVNMDHHCVWINRCVGAGNHRFFLQFISFITIGCSVFCILGYQTMYYNYWKPETKKLFCRMDLNFPWVYSLCSLGDEFISASIFFAYFLCAIIFLLVGGLFIWNVLLISNGQTYVGLLKGDYSHLNRSTKEFLTPWRRNDFIDVWKDFLGLRRGRTFWRHIALPSSHRTNVPLAWDDDTVDNERLLEIV